MSRLFGISLRDEERCEALLRKLPRFCRLLEFPGGLLDSLRARREAADRCAASGIEWGVRDLLDANLARQLAQAGETLRFEALRKFEERARAAASSGAAWASLDLDAGRAAADPGYEPFFHDLVRQLGGILARTKSRFALLLPVRIPSAEAASPENLLRFRHRLPLPGFRLVFELHPHEPGALAWAGIETLRFEARHWRICFDPASGNTLAPAALNRFLDAGPLPPEPMRILFSPEGAAVPDDYMLKQLADTAEKWENLK